MATRATIRRAIGARTRQPWFRRFGAVAGAATGGTTTTLIDTAKLLQPNDTWNEQYLYLPATDENRIISDFDLATKTLTILEPVASSIAAATAYEIWSQFSAVDVNEAINQALRDAWPYFFTVTEGYIVLRTGVGVTHSLSSLSPTPKWIAQVLMERLASSVTGTVTAGGTTSQVINSNASFSSADVGKEIRIYEGTSVGDIRTVASVASASTLAVSTAFTAALTTTSKYRLVDVANATAQYDLINDWNVDNPNAPTKLWLSGARSGYEGYKLRILYESEYPALTTDASETTCPQEYLELASLSRLFLTKLASAPASELDNWQALQRVYTEAAQAFANKSAFHHLPGSIVNDQLVGYRRASDWPF